MTMLQYLCNHEVVAFFKITIIVQVEPYALCCTVLEHRRRDKAVVPNDLTITLHSYTGYCTVTA